MKIFQQSTVFSDHFYTNYFRNSVQCFQLIYSENLKGLYTNWLFFNNYINLKILQDFLNSLRVLSEILAGVHRGFIQSFHQRWKIISLRYTNPRFTGICSITSEHNFDSLETFLRKFIINTEIILRDILSCFKP